MLTNLELLTSQNFFIQNLGVVFATKSLLELGGDECDNLNFMNLKMLKFVKIREF